MLKKVFLAGAATLLLAGVTLTVQATPAEACKSGCWKAAKAKYPGSLKQRWSYKKWCWKRYRASRKG